MHCHAFHGGSHFANTSKVLTKDRWLTQTVKGFQIPFVGEPVQERKARVPSLPAEQLVQLQEEVSSLVEKGAVVVVDSQPSQTEFYSVLCPVPKKNGQIRPVNNLKALNEWVTRKSFSFHPSLNSELCPVLTLRLVSRGQTLLFVWRLS